jgi:UDP-3-O-[3-hydroxymyristoyl] glucosamine N-acyltransferase
MSSSHAPSSNSQPLNGAPRNGASRNGHASRNQPVSAGDTAHRMTAGDIALLLGAELVGDAQTLITSVAGIESALPGSILFVENEALLQSAFDSPAAAIIASSAVAEDLHRVEKNNKPTLLTGNPRLAFAKVMEYFQPKPIRVVGVHPSAVVEDDAYVGENVTIGTNCVVGHGVHIGDNTTLHANVVVSDGAQIGDDCTLHAGVVIGHQVNIGKRVLVHPGSVIGSEGFGYVLDNGRHRKVPQLGTVIIEDDVEIGANVCIDRATIGATRIGEGTKIDNLVQIAHNVQIGKNCILCGQVGVSGSVIVEDYVIMAGQAGLADHVKIGKGAILGAKTGIMGNVPSGDVVMGSPAMSQRDFLKREAAARKLPETMRAFRLLEKQVQALQEEVKTLKEDAV